jgi:alcohol dehydrogenase class IV
MMAVATVRDVLIWPHPTVNDDPVIHWGELSYASAMMGINLANSSTCLPHRMQYAFGALTDSSHPEGLAAIYPEWFAVVAQAIPGRVKALLEVLFAKHPMRLEWIARPAEAMREVLRVLGLARSLADLGVDTEEKLEWCIDHVRGTLDVDPAWQGPETVRSIFLSACRRG